MATKVKWYGDKLIKEVGLKCFQNMEKACLFLEGDIKRSFGKSPSAPGEPPGVLTGRMRASMAHEVEMHGKDVIGRVGSTLKKPNYPLYLEYGTSKMAARPWARVALHRNKKKIAQLLGGK